MRSDRFTELPCDTIPLQEAALTRLLAAYTPSCQKSRNSSCKEEIPALCGQTSGYESSPHYEQPSDCKSSLPYGQISGRESSPSYGQISSRESSPSYGQTPADDSPLACGQTHADDSPLSPPGASSLRQKSNSLRYFPVILCIGTDRLIGDSLGPMVGSLLVRSGCPFPVYGTLASPVHALNLAERTAELKERHPFAPVIAIDASLGPGHRIGCISLRPHGLQPGAGVNKRLATAGDISITGITNADSLQPYLSLQTARLSTVMEMAEEICACILRI